MRINMCTSKQAVTLFAVLMGVAVVVQAAVPEGWRLAGSKPASYDTGTEKTAYNGNFAAFLKSRERVSDGFGTLMQSFTAEKYAGKRVRLTATIKSQEVNDWAGLWMRVDKNSQSVAFDNMEQRAIKGTTSWQPYNVVLDVPADATAIYFGVLLSGSGAVWLSEVKFDVVGSDVPVTSAPLTHSEPVNLGFDRGAER